MVERILGFITHRKNRRRATLIVTNSLQQLLVPLLNPIIALLVIRLTSVGQWGGFVNIMIIVQLVAHIIGWGNKEYLLRTFSLNPAGMPYQLQTSLLTRASLMVLFCGALAFGGFSPQQYGLIVIWVISLAWYQSFEVVVLYKKDFIFALFVELGTLAIRIIGILAATDILSIIFLISLFGGSRLLQALVLTIRFRRELSAKRKTSSSLIDVLSLLHNRFQIRYFVLALPFFLLGFSGLLQSRIDLYSVSYFLTEAEVGRYQIFINLLLYLQSFANFILMPFIKELYRMKSETIHKISRRLFSFGAIITPPAMAVLSMILQLVFEISFMPIFFVLGGLFVIPIYYYLPIIYTLYKRRRETTVLKVNILGTAFTLLLNMLLLPNIGLLGAVISIAVVRWIVFALYIWVDRFRPPVPHLQPTQRGI